MTVPAIDVVSLTHQLARVEKDSFQGKGETRAHLLNEAQKLVRRLEDPFETIRRITFAEV
jgi:hypothetical protein